jgi:NAD(P)-dependent dehydrogenase (short-subunit alcohol dehydrogenase family)
MNKLAVVTGITRGIGRAIAEIFAQHGWQVVGSASSAASKAAFDALQLPGCTCLVADLSQPDAVVAFGQAVLHQFGAPAVLVNNAGKYYPGALLTEPDDHFTRLMNLNVAGPYYLTKTLATRMVERGSGTIVNICSTASAKAYPNGGSYGISKHALLGFSRNLREELKPTGVRVVAVLPGPTLTDSWQGTDLPAERFMAPADIAQAVWLACSLPATTVVEEIVLRPQLGDI